MGNGTLWSSDWDQERAKNLCNLQKAIIERWFHHVSVQYLSAPLSEQRECLHPYYSNFRLLGRLGPCALRINNSVIWNFFTGRRQRRKRGKYSKWNFFRSDLMLITPQFLILIRTLTITYTAYWIVAWWLSVGQRYNLKANHNQNLLVLSCWFRWLSVGQRHNLNWSEAEISEAKINLNSGCDIESSSECCDDQQLKKYNLNLSKAESNEIRTGDY